MWNLEITDYENLRIGCLKKKNTWFWKVKAGLGKTCNTKASKFVQLTKRYGEDVTDRIHLMGIRNTYKLLVSNPEENKPLGNT